MVIAKGDTKGKRVMISTKFLVMREEGGKFSEKS